MRKSYTFLLASLCFTLNAHSQNSSLNFTGTNRVTAGVDAINPNGDFTLELWAYVPHTAVNDGLVHQFASEGSAGFEFSLGYLADGTIQVGNPDWFTSTGVQVPQDQWTHIALSFSSASGVAQLYFNGHLKASIPDFFFTDDQPFRLGTNVDLSQSFIGRLDEVKTWSVARSQSQVRTDMFTIPSSSDNSLTLYFEMNEGSNTSVSNSAGSGLSQAGTIAGDPGGSNSWAGSPIQYGNNALVFDGSTNEINIAPLAGNQLDLANGGTVEFYVNPTSLPSSGWATVLGNRGTGGVRYSFHLSQTQIGLDNGGPSPNTLDYAVPTGPNQWTHLAFVYDNVANATTVYANGQFQGTINGGLGSATGQPLTIGMSKNISGADNNAFAGGVDEVRIWNIKRTTSQIGANWKNTLTGTESGLIAQYTFDQGAPDADDQGLSTAFDNTANANDGTMQNFLLNGTTSNFTSHALLSAPLPVTIAAFNAARSGNESVLQWQTATEQNSREFIIERSTDGRNYTEIGSVAAAGNSNTLQNYTYTDPQPLPNSNFYRLKQVDLDGNFDYSVVRTVNFPANAANKLIWYLTGRTSAGILLQGGNAEPFALYDAGGRLLRAGNLSYGSAQVSQLPPGIYFLRVSTRTITISIP